ncbi:MAG: iron-containing alcohol dehydrogenase [Proteobacteria bacterium]|nr:iron-containing alcohol dehydrogenase [Pseudomonadota bacterium]MBU1452569.1 iron-containing alcohol dehydrogenase [Pseudomonadota bacterium]MBU2469244.1 iron-containing alcohol dehydrogenase [Pseudomonadota bacterium]MBU2517038.1 iron-containing alcohol dehydrogenase [Pseudomonadota bacterium]
MSARISIFRTTPRIVMGPGSVAGVGKEALDLGARRVLVVTDPGIVDAGLLDPVRQSLEAAGLEFSLFSEVAPDPRYQTVKTCLGVLEGDKPDCVIGLGGGSPIDIAKTVAVMLNNAGDISDYCGVDLVPKAGAPTIIIPTTAGTGSEVTPIAILSDEQEKLKKGVVSPHLMPRVAVLDPELTVGLPPAITAATGMDALIHAIEAYTSVGATGMTDMLAARAIELIGDNLRTAYARGHDLQAREAMLEGSLLAGIAFANAGVTAVHAFAYPIGAEFHIPHGVANTLMLAPVMRFNLVGNLIKFAEVAEFMGQPVEGLSLREAAEMAVEAVWELADDLGVPKSLKQFGVTEEHLPALAQGVMKVTRLLANNPRTITAADAEKIYRQAL